MGEPLCAPFDEWQRHVAGLVKRELVKGFVIQQPLLSPTSNSVSPTPYKELTNSLNGE
jgi:hypothetical protein